MQYGGVYKQGGASFFPPTGSTQAAVTNEPFTRISTPEREDYPNSDDTAQLLQEDGFVPAQDGPIDGNAPLNADDSITESGGNRQTASAHRRGPQYVFRQHSSRKRYTYVQPALHAVYSDRAHFEHCIWQFCTLVGQEVCILRTREKTFECACSHSGQTVAAERHPNEALHRDDHGMSKKTQCTFKIQLRETAQCQYTITSMDSTHTGHSPPGIPSHDTTGARFVRINVLPVTYGILELLETIAVSCVRNKLKETLINQSS